MVVVVVLEGTPAVAAVDQVEITQVVKLRLPLPSMLTARPLLLLVLDYRTEVEEMVDVDEIIGNKIDLALVERHRSTPRHLRLYLVAIKARRLETARMSTTTVKEAKTHCRGM